MHRRPAAALLLLALALGAAACGMSSQPTPATPFASSPDTPVAAPEPTPVPGGSGGPAGSPPAVVLPEVPGGPVLVVPQPGVRDPRPVHATGLAVAVEDGQLVATVTWWSGIEPCTALAGVAVDRDGDRYTITVAEGAGGDLDVACIDIAVEKQTRVVLGPAEPGTWTVDAGGEAGEVAITIE